MAREYAGVSGDVGGIYLLLHTIRLPMANDLPDLGSLGLPELGKLDDFYTRNAKAETRAAKAKGGFGPNKVDESAREFSRKQVAVGGEIFDRLSDINQERSPHARELDNAFKAPIADSPDQWASDPSHYDWPGIDTPRR